MDVIIFEISPNYILGGRVDRSDLSEISLCVGVNTSWTSRGRTPVSLKVNKVSQQRKVKQAVHVLTPKDHWRDLLLSSGGPAAMTLIPA